MNGALRTIFLAASAATAHAQLAAPVEAELVRGGSTIKWSPKALTADITATATVKTPWGVLQNTETGKYWRNGKGLIRQDDQHGISLLLDMRERSNKRILIDSWLKVINEDYWPAPVSRGTAPYMTQNEQEQRYQTDSIPLGTYRYNGARLGDWVDQFEVQYWRYFDERKLKRVNPTTTSVEGIKIKIYKLPHGPGTMEWWISHDLKFLVLTRFVTEAAEFEQRYHNIRLQDVSDSLFQLPIEYPLRSINYGLPARMGETDQNTANGTVEDRCLQAFRTTDGLTGQDRKKSGVAQMYRVGCPEVE